MTAPYRGRASSDTTHECPKEGCTRRVRQTQLACRNHWYLVSKPTRDAVWEAYMADNLDAHHAAITAAITEMNR